MTSADWASQSRVQLRTSGPPAQQVDFWREMVLRLFADVQIDSITAPQFKAQLCSQSDRHWRISEIRSSPQTVQRRHHEPQAAYEDRYFAVLMLEGQQILQQDGREVLLNPGDFALYDATRPHRLRFGQAWRELVLSVPRLNLQTLAPHVEQQTATVIDLNNGIGQVFRNYLEGLNQQIGQLDDHSMQRLASTSLDLLALSLNQQRPPQTLRHVSQTLQRIKRHIHTRLHDPELNTASVANAVGLSPRYINKLFATENTSLMRYVWQSRLTHCAQELSASHDSQKYVSAIAMRWGFNDLSHFSRSFRQRYGVSPRAWRGGDS